MRVNHIIIWPLLIAGAAGALAGLLLHFQLIPVTEELRFDLSAGRMQYSRSLLGFNWPEDIHRYYYRDRLAKLYQQYVGEPAGAEWVLVYRRSSFRGEEVQTEKTPFYGIQWDQNGLANAIENKGLKGPLSPYGITANAAQTMILAFLKLAREDGNNRRARGYAAAAMHAVKEADHVLDSGDILHLELER